MAAQDDNQRLERIEAMLEAVVGGETQRSREWVIDLEDYATEEEFRDAVARELAAAEHLGHRTGRGIVATPIRMQMQRPVDLKVDWITRGWVFREVFVPAARPVEAPELEVVDEPAPEQPELEPVA